MKIVIIGGTGLIGRKLATKLQSGGHHVVAASLRPESIASQARAFIEPLLDRVAGPPDGPLQGIFPKHSLGAVSH